MLLGISPELICFLLHSRTSCLTRDVLKGTGQSANDRLGPPLS